MFVYLHTQGCFFFAQLAEIARTAQIGEWKSLMSRNRVRPNLQSNTMAGHLIRSSRAHMSQGWAGARGHAQLRMVAATRRPCACWLFWNSKQNSRSEISCSTGSIGHASTLEELNDHCDSLEDISDIPKAAPGGGVCWSDISKIASLCGMTKLSALHTGSWKRSAMMSTGSGIGARIFFVESQGRKVSILDWKGDSNPGDWIWHAWQTFGKSTSLRRFCIKFGVEKGLREWPKGG